MKYDEFFEPEGTVCFNPEAFKTMPRSEERKYDPTKKAEGLLAPFSPSRSAFVRSNGALLPEGRAEKLLTPQDKAEAQVYASIGRRFFLHAPVGRSKIEVENDGEKDSLLLSLDFKARQEAEVLLVFEGEGAGIYFLEVEAEEGSKASVTVICRGGGEKFIYDSTGIASGSAVKRNLLCLGGKFIGYSSRVFFSGPRAEAEINGIYFVCGGFTETKVKVAHAVPDCKSRVSYRGALLGQTAGSAWVGKSVIGQGGKGSDSYELNKNFILTPGAKSFSEPQLEIKNGDILAAGHSSSVGYFDPNQIFYLKSRGIAEKEAKQMIVSGFFEELLSQMESEAAKREFEEFCKRMGGFNGAQA